MKRIRTILALLVVAAVAAASGRLDARPRRPRTQADIVGTAVGAGQFTTLTKLLTRCGPRGDAAAAGPYTVFAPTDAAFAKVPKATLDALLRDKAKLRAVLLYHVVAGKVTANRGRQAALGQDPERQERRASASPARMSSSTTRRSRRPT